jgi:hypothetical protein
MLRTASPDRRKILSPIKGSKVMESTRFLEALERYARQFFSLSWKRLHTPQNLECNALSNAGVYAIALVHSNQILRMQNIIYIGMTTSSKRHLRKRLTEFRDGIEINGRHSAAINFFKRHDKPFSQLRLIPLSQVIPHLAFEERRTRSGAGEGILREA